MKCKHLLFTTIAIAVSATLSAQVSKGDILLGATLGTGYNNSSSGAINTSQSNSNLSPRIGFGVGNNSILGARISVGYGTTKTEEFDNKSTNFTYGTSVYWRKLMPISKQIGWYLEPAAGVAFSNNTNKSQGIKSKYSNTAFTVAAVPGIYYQPIPKLLISADFGGVSYSHGTNKSPNGIKTKSNDVSLSLLQRFTFGIDFILGKKA